MQPRSFPTETVFAMEATPIKFGPGVTAEVGYDLQRLGVRNALIVTDPTIVRLGLADQVRRAVEAEGAGATVFDGVHVEPTDESFEAAIRFARDGDFDGFVGLGGGSALDTAKAANLYATYPADLFYDESPVPFLNEHFKLGRHGWNPPARWRPHPRGGCGVGP